MLQQEIAEELERERKRNKKDLSALQHTNTTIARQRDEAQRVVLHLRSLINGQTHHMEHIIRSLGSAPELGEYIQEGFEDVPENTEEGEEEAAAPTAKDTSIVGTLKGIAGLKLESRAGADSPASTVDGSGKPLDGEDVTPEMESHFFNSDKQNKRFSQLSMSDVADRHLRDKTDAIADIIRNISEQCAAAVEGLQLAQDAEEDEEAEALPEKSSGPAAGGHHREDSGNLAPASEDGHASVRTEGSEVGENESGYLSPDNRNSSIPPTPDLVHNRSSTSMSMNSQSTVPERSSQQYAPGDVPTKIVEDDDEHMAAHEERSDDGNVSAQAEPGVVTKQQSQDLMSRPTTARVVQ